MKQTAANLLTIVGGVWTAVIGIVLLGFIISIGEAQDQPVTLIVVLSLLLAVGIGLFYSGLRFQKKR